MIVIIIVTIIIIIIIITSIIIIVCDYTVFAFFYSNYMQIHYFYLHVDCNVS